MTDENNYNIFDGEDGTDLWSVEEGVDLDGDGISDAVVTDYDLDGDGYIDVETAEIDLDSDGMDDMLIADYDLDGDGYVDVETMAGDTNSDGYIDITTTDLDLDGDGLIDVSVLEADTNYDTLVDYAEVTSITYNEDGSTTEYYANASDTDYDGQFDDFDYGVNELADDDGDIAPITYDEPETYTEPEPVSYEEPETYTEPEPVVYEETTEVEPLTYDEPEDDFYSEPDATEDDDNTYNLVSSEDLDGDGEDDFLVTEIDTDGDGVADGFMYAADLDSDGKADITFTQLDTDGDGDYDTMELKAISYEEDGSAREFFVRGQDLDDDGEIDNIDFGSNELSAEEVEDNDVFAIANDEEDETEFESFESEETEESEDYENLDNTEYEEDDNVDYLDYEDTDDVDTDTEEDEFDYADYEEDDEEGLVLPTVDYDTTRENGTYYDELDNFDPADADNEGVIGDPEDALEYWEFQGQTNRCAIYAQKFVIEEYLGREVDIEELVDVATENGWFDENSGTTVMNMDNLLDHYGVPNEPSAFNTIEDLTESLNEGHRVIVSVDADEYWMGEDDDGSVFVPDDGPNHAIEVIGVDTSDPENPVVIVNDSGTPNGQGLEIPMETFMDAWEDGNCFMIEC